MGCGTSQYDWEQVSQGPRTRAESPDDTQYYRHMLEKHYLEQQKTLAQADKDRRRSSNIAWFNQTSLNITQMAGRNMFLKSLLYEPSKKKTVLEPILPNLSSWPQEPAPLDKVMIGRIRSDIRLTSSLRGSGDSGKPVKKAKVICYLPPGSEEHVKKLLASRKSLEPVHTKSSTTAYLTTPIHQAEPRIFTPGVKTFPAEKVRIAYAKCLTANHFGTVTRAKAIFTESYAPKGNYPVVSVCEDFPAVHLVVGLSGLVREEPTSYDRNTPKPGPDPCAKYAEGPSVKVESPSVKTKAKYVKSTSVKLNAKYAEGRSSVEVEVLHDLKTIRSADVMEIAEVPYERSSMTPPNTKCFPWLALEERPETMSPVGANTYTPVCPVEYTSDPHLSCVHTLRRYGKVAFETALTVDLKESSTPLESVKPVGVTSAVKSSYIESASALRKRQLHGISVKEAPGYFYYSARVIQYPNPWRALRVLPPPNEVMGVSTFVQTNDFLHTAVLSQPRSYFVRPTQRCHSACLEAVQKVDYDQVYRITGDEEEFMTLSPQLENPEDGETQLNLTRKVEEKGKGDAVPFIKHEMGFLPGVVTEEPVVVKNRIILNVEDLAPSVMRGPEPEGRMSNFSVNASVRMSSVRQSSMRQSRVSDASGTQQTARPPSLPRPYSQQASRPPSRGLNRIPSESDVT